MKNEDGRYVYHSYEQLRIENEKIKQILLSGAMRSSSDLLLDEGEALAFLKISKSTLYKYRKQLKIRVIRYFGRNMYAKHQLIGVILDQLLKV